MSYWRRETSKRRQISLVGAAFSLSSTRESIPARLYCLQQRSTSFSSAKCRWRDSYFAALVVAKPFSRRMKGNPYELDISVSHSTALSGGTNQFWHRPNGILGIGRFVKKKMTTCVDFNPGYNRLSDSSTQEKLYRDTVDVT